jgi:5-methylcytosine-specific restriction endonuclease McrA
MHRPPPLADHVVTQLERAVIAAVEGHDDAARESLAAISTPDFARLQRFRPNVSVDAPVTTSLALVPRSPRQTAAKATYAQIFNRDHYTCRYCGTRTVHLRVLTLLSHLFPKEFPGDENHWAPPTHSVYWGYSTSFEHSDPVHRGGQDTLENVVTACARCNYGKNGTLLSALGWKILPIPNTEWDGLTGYYPALLKRTPTATAPAYLHWLRAFEVLNGSVRPPSGLPSGASSKYQSDLAASSAAAQTSAVLLRAWAEMDGRVVDERGSRLAVSIGPDEVVSLYPAFESVYFDLRRLRASGMRAEADSLRNTLREFTTREPAEKQPSLRCDAFVVCWAQVESTVLPPLVSAYLALSSAGARPVSGAS